MRHKQRTRFQTFVIPKRRIIRICVLMGVALCLGVGMLVLKFVPKQAQKLAFSDEFYKTVIQTELHQAPQTGQDPKELLSKILGFDPRDGLSILKQSAIVYETPAPTPVPTAAPPSQPPTAEEHDIAEINIAKGMEISNKTNISVNTTALAQEELAYTLDTNGPQVLIVHTHTTESFTDAGKTKYAVTDSDRSTDETKNMTAVGGAMARILNENGINTMQDKTVHDYPSYSGAYTRSLATVQQNLKNHPSIKVVLDVHRDGIVRADGTKLKVTTELNGKKTAQCMFVVGTNANLTHDHWMENMKLACKLQMTANEMYPGLMRPINLREERFNQQASMGSIIIEVGSNGNTLEEAIRGAEAMAHVLVKVLKKG